jgi:branched-chain amino acid transport system ATP-binding protein
MTLLVDRIRTRIGVTPVHQGVSISVAERETVAILGSIGAGKTSLLRAIMGLLPLSEGSISLFGADISNEAPHTRNILGLGYVPEGRRVFAPMTVRENLELGAYGRATKGDALQNSIEQMFSRFPVLREKAEATAGSLSGGEQQMLAIARALMSQPRILLLDEPSLGLAPQIVVTVRNVIRDLAQKTDTAVLLVEQNAGLALSVADRVYLMARGTIVDEGTPAQLEQGDILRSLYLGEVGAEPENSYQRAQR